MPGRVLSAIAMTLAIGPVAWTNVSLRAQESACAGGATTVQPDDTLSRIASRCAVSEGSLLAANPGIDGSADLQVGSTVRLQSAASQGQRLGERLNNYAREANDALGRVAGRVGASA